MHPEYDVLYKWDSYTCASDQLVCFIGWLRLAMEVQGSMPKVQFMCTSKETVPPLSFWKSNSLRLFNVRVKTILKGHSLG